MGQFGGNTFVIEVQSSKMTEEKKQEKKRKGKGRKGKRKKEKKNSNQDIMRLTLFLCKIDITCCCHTSSSNNIRLYMVFIVLNQGNDLAAMNDNLFYNR